VTAAELVALLRARDVRLWPEGDRLRCSAPVGVLDEPTKAELASRRDEILSFLRHADALELGPAAVVPLKASGSRPPLFAFPGHNGDVFCYVALARRMDPDQPLFAIEPPGLADDTPIESVEALARHAIEHIRAQRSKGPYLLAGYCAGGTIAFEAARQLARSGESVPMVALIGSAFPTLYRLRERPHRWLFRLRGQARRHLTGLTSGSLRDAIAYVRARHAERSRWRRAAQAPSPLQEVRTRLESATLRALARYQPSRYEGRVDLFLPSEEWRATPARPHLWRTVAGSVREHVGRDGLDLDGMLREPNAAALAGALAACMGAPALPEEGGPLGVERPRTS
jgi:thioesterase domain-containing protein